MQLADWIFANLFDQSQLILEEFCNRDVLSYVPDHDGGGRGGRQSFLPSFSQDKAVKTSKFT